MDIVKSILDYFEKHEHASSETAPEGLCPVCWGYQQYDEKIRSLFKEKQIDVNNHQAKYLIVQDFLKKHIEGIHIRQGKVESCPQCSNQKRIIKL